MRYHSTTQPCCARCFERRYPGQTARRRNLPDAEICVFCNQATKAGIFVKVDPETAPYPSLTRYGGERGK